MNTIFKALCCTVAMSAMAACAQTDNPKPQSDAIAGPIAGTVNGESIPQNAYDLFLSSQFRKDIAQLTEEEKTRGREGFVQMMALAQEARKLGLQDDPQLRGQLFVQEKSALARALMEKKTAEDPIDDAKLRSAYEAQLNSGAAREYNARHILVETEEAARAVIAKLDEGSDFVELAKTESTGPSGPNGGDLGWFGAGRMVQPFWDATVKLESGAYTTEPVQTQFGWHVILLEQTRDRPFAEAEQELRGNLQREWVENYVKSLGDAASARWNAPVEAENPPN
jgi:peptidyl-prolyl cis-trans isomerase C